MPGLSLEKHAPQTRCSALLLANQPTECDSKGGSALDGKWVPAGFSSWIEAFVTSKARVRFDFCTRVLKNS